MGAADFIFHQIHSLAGGPHLLSGNGNPTYPFGSPFDQAVIMALAGSADYHHMVGTVPGSHPHAPQVILKNAPKRSPRL